MKVKPKEWAHIPFLFMNPLERVYTPLRGESNYPAVIINNYRRGRIVYFAFPIGAFYGSDRIGTQERLITSSIDYLRNPEIVISAPPTVEAEFYRQKNNGRLILFLVNNTGDMQRPISYINPVSSIEVSVKNRSIKSVYSLAGDREIAFEGKDDFITFTLPLLKEFDIIKLEEVQ